MAPPSFSNTGKFVTSKARNVLYTRLGDITVGTAYFWFILLGLLANFFTMIITWALATSTKGLGLSMPPIDFAALGSGKALAPPDIEFE